MVIALAFVLSGCSPNADATTNPNPVQTNDTGSQEKKPPLSNMKPQDPPALTDEQTQQLAAGQAAHSPSTLTFTVDAGNFYFSPNVIHVKKGDTVKIVFKNDGGFHDWILDEFNVTMEPIKGGETAELQFVADKAGTFEYYCSVGSHRAMGMKGQLIVE